MPNLALTRAIAWRRLAALRDRVASPRSGRRKPPRIDDAEAASGGPEAQATSARLAPVIVDYFGRDGSTAMLRLLASSPAILVEGGYPYESTRLAEVLLAGGLKRAAEGGAGADAAAARIWGESSRALLAGATGPDAPRYYAEKLLDSRRLPPDTLPGMRTIVVLRDPRDTLVSIESFSRAVGTTEMGGGSGREELLGRFVRRQRQRLRWIASLNEDERTIVVGYRDLVTELPSVAGRLAAWLGVELDPGEVARDFRLRWVHATSRDPRRSIGRWARELDPATASRLEEEIGPEMRALGFD